MNWLKTIPYILLTPFYMMLCAFIYYFFVSLTPAQEVRIIDYKPKTVVAGDEITITYDVRRYRDCENHVTRFLYNKRTLSSSSIGYIERAVLKGNDPHFDSIIRIPTNIPNGEYELSSENKPICNFYDYFFPSTINIPSVSIIIDNNPANIKTLEVLNENKKLKHGEPLLLRNIFTKRRFCAATVDTFIFRDDNVLMSKFSRPTTSQQLGENDVKEALPIDLVPGKYTVNRTVTYTCPERVYNYKYDSPIFEVTP